MMSHRVQSWIPTAVFWILFAASIGLAKRFPWLDTLWYGGLVLVLLALSAYSVTYAFRHRHETGSISYQRVPTRLRRFFLDEDEKKAK